MYSRKRPMSSSTCSNTSIIKSNFCGTSSTLRTNAIAKSALAGSWQELISQSDCRNQGEQSTKEVATLQYAEIGSLGHLLDLRECVAPSMLQENVMARPQEFKKPSTDFVRG